MGVKVFAKDGGGGAAPDSASVDPGALVVREAVDDHVAVGDIRYKFLILLAEVLLVRGEELHFHQGIAK